MYQLIQRIESSVYRRVVSIGMLSMRWTSTDDRVRTGVGLLNERPDEPGAEPEREHEHERDFRARSRAEHRRSVDESRTAAVEDDRRDRADHDDRAGHGDTLEVPLRVTDRYERFQRHRSNAARHSPTRRLRRTRTIPSPSRRRSACFDAQP